MAGDILLAAKPKDTAEQREIAPKKLQQLPYICNTSRPGVVKQSTF
jgi:hypothetical protein